LANAPAKPYGQINFNYREADEQNIVMKKNQNHGINGLFIKSFSVIIVVLSGILW